jgi:hypothetical protein
MEYFQEKLEFVILAFRIKKKGKKKISWYVVFV